MASTTQDLGPLIANLGNLIGGFAGAIRSLVLQIPQLVNVARVGSTGQAAGSLASAAVQTGAAAAGAAGGGAASAIGGVATRIGSLLGPIGLTAAALVSLSALAGVFGKSLLEANRHLAEFSPAMAAVFAQSDVRDIQRSMKQGEETAGSTQFLASAVADFKDTMRPVVSLLTNILNVVGGVLVRVAENILKPIAWIAEKINAIFEWLKKKFGIKEEEHISVGKWLDEVAADARRARERNDPAFSKIGLPRDPVRF